MGTKNLPKSYWWLLILLLLLSTCLGWNFCRSQNDVLKILAVLSFYNAFLIVTYFLIYLFFYKVINRSRINGKYSSVCFWRAMNRFGPKITVIGGGTGLATLLRGLKKYSGNLTAVVTTADDGGSSGKLRKSLGILPPGDIRNCIIALADQEPLMESLFQYRFSTESGLSGHNFGNLFIAAMADITGDFEQAIEEFSKVLAITGKVIPATLENVTLCAEMCDGQIVIGESEIPKQGKQIKKVFLKPESPRANRAAIEAILDADCVVLGPGSLYTSVIPNLLLPEICHALNNTKAIKIYACNVMTQPGETTGYGAYDHVKAILSHCPGKNVIEMVIVNTEDVPPELLQKYEAEGAHPVTPDIQQLQKEKFRVIGRHLISKTSLVRHDSEKLARLVIQLVIQEKFWREGLNSSLLKWMTIPSLLSLVSRHKSFPHKGLISEAAHMNREKGG